MEQKNNGHQKHTKLQRPNFGQFARQEWTLIGAPCGAIQKLAQQLITELSACYHIAYVDADHSDADGHDVRHKYLAAGAQSSYTDKINFSRFDFNGHPDAFKFRQIFNGQDAVLVNGNHFKGARQIVIIDPRKKESLQRKLDRLNDVQAFVLTEGETEIYDFLKSAIPYWQQLPTFSMNEPKAIATFIEKQLKNNIAPLNGLVLAGGKSTRMGRDKALLNYHGKPQQEHVFELLDNCCENTFLSVREEQAGQLGHFPTLPDTFTGLGPFGAILSAFREVPDSAWLVVAVDLPLLEEATFKQLIAHRQPSKLATAFYNPATDFPEPLITIWEPRAYPVLLQFLAQGYSCPRKVLINSDIEMLQLANPDVLRNVNSPEDFEAMNNGQ